MKRLILLFILSISWMMFSSCSSGESKAKKTVTEFCNSYNSGQLDKASELFPSFTEGVANTSKVNTKSLNATLENDTWTVEDDANHTFYVNEKDGKYLIKDSRNIIEWKSKSLAETDLLIAKRLGLVDDDSTDIERLKSYSILQDGSDLISFLKSKYPKAFVYGISVDNVRKSIEGGMGIYWMEVKATLKSGSQDPLGAVNVIFIFKDKEGKEVKRDSQLARMSANNTEVVDGMIDLNDYPNVKEVSVELEPFRRPKDLTTTDILYIFAPLSEKDYQEYLDKSK